MVYFALFLSQGIVLLKTQMKYVMLIRYNFISKVRCMKILNEP